MKVENNEELLDVFKSKANEYGTEIYKLDIKKINPQQSHKLKCLSPLCEFYGVCKVCPPNIPSVSEFREALQSYSMAFLVVYKEEVVDIENYQYECTAEKKVGETISALEWASIELGYYHVLGLGVGGCKYCSSCTPLGEPCRNPFKARPSPSGYGINATQLAIEAGVPIEWPPKKYVSFLGLVLL